jgi:hypothetical protein
VARIPRNRRELLAYRLSAQAVAFEACARHLSFSLKTGQTAEQAAEQFARWAAERRELAADPERAEAEGHQP